MLNALLSPLLRVQTHGRRGTSQGGSRRRDTKRVGFRGKAKLLLVLEVNEMAQLQEVYAGPLSAARKIAKKSKRDRKFTVSLVQLRALNKHALPAVRCGFSDAYTPYVAAPLKNAA
ncbi:DUF6998 domain-containing protein [Ensifer adhaerens]|uniref:DUF6998 domain-containing protein n=1 Tax=Ensifer adhaerens TaxID=106592 RepID=UPI003CD00BA2